MPRRPPPSPWSKPHGGAWCGGGDTSSSSTTRPHYPHNEEPGPSEVSLDPMSPSLPEELFPPAPPDIEFLPAHELPDPLELLEPQ
mmetsp:Transcript_65220/g.182384  ORF Transcript_65220/g.182384 Transcript_65220/m.182384 type:complete len:85 (+) Transcript_65220:468-722(+)